MAQQTYPLKLKELHIEAIIRNPKKIGLSATGRFGTYPLKFKELYIEAIIRNPKRQVFSATGLGLCVGLSVRKPLRKLQK